MMHVRTFEGEANLSTKLRLIIREYKREMIHRKQKSKSLQSNVLFFLQSICCCRQSCNALA